MERASGLARGRQERVHDGNLEAAPEHRTSRGANVPSTELSGTPLPRLIFFGDVPVCNTSAGASFLYRLLGWYPPERLTVWAPSGSRDRELAGVSYVPTDARFPRLLRSRLGPLYCVWITWRLLRVQRWASSAAARFEPEAILTIAHAGAWAGAWQLAREREIPLLILAHDDHAYANYLPGPFRSGAERRFASVYRDAAARFCISPAMAEVYQRRYGVGAEILYPTRDPAAPVFDTVSPRSIEAGRALTLCYSGSVYGEADASHLARLAEEVAARGHRMLIVSAQHEQVAGALTRNLDRITTRPPIAADRFHATLRAEVDCFLVTGTFDESRRAETSTSFPSKLADYSAIGAPVLVWAPDYAAISRFVRENADSAELVTSSAVMDAADAMDRLSESPVRRQQLAARAIEVGSQYFSAQAAWETFRRALEAVR